jgi:hypothetical protein
MEKIAEAFDDPGEREGVSGTTALPVSGFYRTATSRFRPGHLQVFMY